jgi:hypothetical protein
MVIAPGEARAMFSNLLDYSGENGLKSGETEGHIKKPHAD